MQADSLKQQLARRAEELGYRAFGVARAEPLQPEGRQLSQWLADGHHGQMGYMADTAEVRADPGHAGMLPGARSIVVLATPYARDEPPQGPAPGRVARYAQGRDYHNLLYKRGRKLAALLREAGHAVRVAVDSMPVFERAWAQRAGLGFIGKNCCLIVPGLGSHVLLSALVTDAALPADTPQRERCGECTRCLDACPTGAFLGPRQLDARRCISYLTIEQRGPIAVEHRPALGDWLFGCDACQDVCPFNATRVCDPSVTEPFQSHERWREVSAADLLTMDDETFAQYAQGSPIKRPGRRGMARNAAIVLGNRGDRRVLPLLEKTARDHDCDVVREAASWAARSLRER